MEVFFRFLLAFASVFVNLVSPVWTIDGHREIVFAAVMAWWYYVTVARVITVIVGRTFGLIAPEWFQKFLYFSPPWRWPYLIVIAPINWWRRQMRIRRPAAASWESMPGMSARYVFRKGRGLLIGVLVYRGKALFQTVAISGQLSINIFGQAGSGKSGSLGSMLGSLDDRSSAMFVDVGGGLTRALGRWLGKHHPFFVLNFNDGKNITRAAWNPLDEMTAAVEMTGRKRTAAEVARTIGESVVLQENETQKTFDNGGRSFLIAVVVYVWLTAPPERRNLTRVRELLCRGLPPKEKQTPLQALTFEMLDRVNEDDGAGGVLNALIANGASFIRGSMNNEGGNPYLSSAIRATDWLDYGVMQESTSRSDFLMRDLKRGNTVVSISGSISDVKTTYQPFVRLAFALMSYTFEKMPRCRKVPALAIIDEAQNIGALSMTESAAHVRKHELQIVACWQDLPGMIAVYPKTYKSILANADANIFLATACKTTLEYISGYLGKHKVRTKVGGTPWWARPFVSKERQVRPTYREDVVDLLNPEQTKDLLTPGRGRGVVASANRPFIIKVFPFWKALPVWRYDADGYPEPWARMLARMVVTNLPAVGEWAKPKLRALAETVHGIYEGRLQQHIKSYWIAVFAISIGGAVWDAGNSGGSLLWLVTRPIGLAGIVIGCANVVRFICMPFASALWKRRDGFPERGHMYHPLLFPLAFITMLLGMLYVVPMALAQAFFPDPAPVLQAVVSNWNGGDYFELAAAVLFTVFLGVWFLAAFIGGLMGAWMMLTSWMMGVIATMYFFWYFVGVPILLWGLRTLLNALAVPLDEQTPFRRAVIRWLGEKVSAASQHPNSGEGPS